MITNPRDRITTTQASLMIMNYLIAVGSITLPRIVAETVGTVDGWISVILGGFLALLGAYIVGKLSLRFHDQTFFEFNQSIIGKLPGILLSLMMIIYFIGYAGYEARLMSEVIRMYVLDQTPIEVVILIFMGVSTYLVAGGINPIARICELFFPGIFFILLVTLLLSIRDFEVDNLRPVLSKGLMPVLAGIQSTILPFLGFEIMLIFTSFMKHPNQVIKSTLVGISVVIPIYTLIVVMTIGNLTLEEVKTLTWPLMSLAMSFELPGGFFERLESLLVLIFVMYMFTTFFIAQYIASLGLAQLFRKKISYFIYGLFPCIYWVAMYPDDLNNAFNVGEYLSYGGMFLAGVMPLLLWLIAKARRIGNE